MKKNLIKNKGFTLVELLVVIAIIAILTSMVMANIYASRSKARDAKRISDINQIQLALEQYFDKNYEYPSTLDKLLGTYISVIPTAPNPGSYEYSVRNDYFDYVLKAQLENNDTSLVDSLDSFPIPPSGASYSPTFTCDKTVKHYCIGPK